MNSVASRVRHGRLSALTLGFVPFIAALAVVLALPRLVEGLLLLPGNAAIDDIQNGHLDATAIETLVKSRDRALALVDRGQSHRDAATGHLLLASAVPLPPETRSAELDRALAEARRAVAESPADPVAWYRLASVVMARDDANQAVVDAVFQSIDRGPFETELLVPRLDLLFAARSYLGSETDGTVDEQIRVAWKRHPRAVVLSVRRYGAGDIVRRALEREPSMARDLDASFKDPNIR